jgi:hypothetical protein
MTDDLVKRLREYGACGMVFEAADRIEELEAALRLMLDNDRNMHKSLEELFAKFCIEARKALEGKDD